MTYERELMAPVAATHEGLVRTITSNVRGKRCNDDKPRNDGMWTLRLSAQLQWKDATRNLSKCCDCVDKLRMTYGRELIAPLAAEHERPVRTITSNVRGKRCNDDTPRKRWHVCAPSKCIIVVERRNE